MTSLCVHTCVIKWIVSFTPILQQRSTLSFELLYLLLPCKPTALTAPIPSHPFERLASMSTSYWGIFVPQACRHAAWAQCDFWLDDFKMFAGSLHQLDSCHSSGFYKDGSAGDWDAGWKRLYVMPPPQWHHSSSWLSPSLCCPSSWFHSKQRPCLCKRLLSLLFGLWETSKRSVVKLRFSIRGCGWRYMGGVGRASWGQELPLFSTLCTGMHSALSWA